MAGVRVCDLGGGVIVHTIPVNDLIDHDTSGDDCLCGPASEPDIRDDGSCGWVVVHHSLGGRERGE
jgi:hypothetical protein